MANKLSYNAAQAIVMKKFCELHPKEVWPDWFISGATLGGIEDKKNLWIFAFTVTKKQFLPPNRYWKEINGRKILVEIDAATGKEFFILHWSVPDSDVIRLFEATVDPDSLDVRVLIDCDLATFDSNEIQLM